MYGIEISDHGSQNWKISPKEYKHCKRKDGTATRSPGRCMNLSPLSILESGYLNVAGSDRVKGPPFPIIMVHCILISLTILYM